MGKVGLGPRPNGRSCGRFGSSWSGTETTLTRDNRGGGSYLALVPPANWGGGGGGGCALRFRPIQSIENSAWIFLCAFNIGPAAAVPVPPPGHSRIH